MPVALADHPLLKADVFACRFPASMGELPTPARILGLLGLAEKAPLSSSDEIRERVRALLRFGGFKPSGRSKPATEYLIKAHQSGTLGSINLAVDVCNAVSLHSGLPISLVDADRAMPPYRIEVVREQRYVFNPSGQELDLDGLLCLWDQQGPCASPVKDSQRTKTDASTRSTLCIIWGEASLSPHVVAAGAWYRELLTECGGQLEG